MKLYGTSYKEVQRDVRNTIILVVEVRTATYTTQPLLPTKNGM